MRGFPAQANGYSFVEAANGVYQKGIEFDSLRFGITEFAIGAQGGQILLSERVFGLGGICLNGETGMAGDKAEHSDGDILRFRGEKHFLNHIGVGVLPVRMQNTWIDSEADSVAVVLATFGGSDSFIEVCCIQFIMTDCVGAVDAPGDNRLVIGFDGKEIIDVAAFSKQHKIGVRESGEKLHENRRKVCNVVEGERIEHFAHIEADFMQRAIGEFSDLPEHCVVIDVDFDEWVVFAIYENEVAVCTAIGTAIRDGNEFVIGATANTGAELPVEFVEERGCLANHQGLFAFEDALAEAGCGGNEPLVVDDFDRRRWEQIHYAASFRKLGGFSPEQNSIRCPGLGGIQN